MAFLPCVLFIVIWIFVKLFKNYSWGQLVIFSFASIALTAVVVGIDFSIQTADTEVWSGRVTSQYHKEEWEEWHEPVYEDKEIKDSNGKVIRVETVKVRDGYWEHHYAENRIETSDEGWITVNESPDGRRFNDKWPNTAEELKQFWPTELPTASVHSYTNRVQASYSIYKHKKIDIKEYPDLPKYPSTVSNYIKVDRIVGNVPNKEVSLGKLSEWNSELNKYIPDPEKPGKKRSWKQVNLIFVNVGSNKSEDYGFALQDSWEGGNKNDFIVSFSMDDQGKLLWVYPFSWSEIELLKLEVRDYMLDLAKITDFSVVVDEVAKKVADKFERKQFADFNYLQIDISTPATIVVWIFNVLLLIVSIRVQESESFLWNNKRRMKW